MPMPLTKPKPVANQKQTIAMPGRTKGVDVKARTVEHYVTTPTVDEQGEVLLPRGADISRFTKTGTVFDVHCYGSASVIGKNISYKIGDDGHVAVTRFAERPPSLPATVEWRPDTLLHLFNTGDISGWSIGFNPMEWREPTSKDQQAYGAGVQLVHTRYRVLEYSVAPLPCNEDAIGLSQRGIISKRLAERLAAGTMPSVADMAMKPHKTIVVMPGLALPPATSASVVTPAIPTKTVVVLLPAIKAAPVAPPSVETIAKHTVLIMQGKLYA